MIDFLFCGYNIFCHLKNINPHRYPPEIAELCEFISKDGQELPDYCQLPNQAKIPRRRSEF
jgi:hypothetical protein